MRHDSRHDSATLIACPVCGRDFPARGRGRFCGPACRYRAYRLRRHQADQVETMDKLAAGLRRARDLVAQTVYQCSRCEERYLGERRCQSCNLMCRKLGLGGRCPGCDDLLTVSELVGIDFEGGGAAA
jgi:hypothetical protein